MKNSKRPLGVSEIALILQGQIEGLTPQQILIRDELVQGGVPQDIATEFMKMAAVDFGGGGAPDIEEVLRAKGASDDVIEYLRSKTARAFSGIIAAQLAENNPGVPKYSSMTIERNHDVLCLPDKG
jgi:hypothetical protein